MIKKNIVSKTQSPCEPLVLLEPEVLFTASWQSIPVDAEDIKLLTRTQRARIPNCWFWKAGYNCLPIKYYCANDKKTHPICTWLWTGNNRLTLNLLSLLSWLLSSLKAGISVEPPSLSCAQALDACWCTAVCDKLVTACCEARTSTSTQVLADNPSDISLQPVFSRGLFSQESGYPRCIRDPVWTQSGALAHPASPVRHVAMKGN